MTDLLRVLELCDLHFPTQDHPRLANMGAGSIQPDKRDGKMPTADRIAPAGKCARRK